MDGLGEFPPNKESPAIHQRRVTACSIGEVERGRNEPRDAQGKLRREVFGQG